MPTRPPNRSIAIALLAVLLLVAAGALVWSRCSTSVQERTVTLYYLDPQGMYLVPVQRRLPLAKNTERALQGALEALSATPPQGLMAPLASGTAVEVKGIQQGRADIRLRIKGASPGSGDEQLMAAALVRTAGDLDAIHEVMLSLFDAKGAPLESEHLDLSEPLSPTDPGMENLYLGGEGEGLAVTVYYSLPGSGFLVPLRVPLPSRFQSEPLKGSFSLLLAGPPRDLQTFLSPSLDARTQLRWNGIEGDVAEILWKNAPSATPSADALRALVLTLTDSGRIKAVQLKREGAPLFGRVGPFDLGAPLPRPSAINPASVSCAPQVTAPVAVS